MENSQGLLGRIGLLNARSVSTFDVLTSDMDLDAVMGSRVQGEGAASTACNLIRVE